MTDISACNSETPGSCLMHLLCTCKISQDFKINYSILLERKILHAITSQFIKFTSNTE